MLRDRDLKSFVTQASFDGEEGELVIRVRRFPPNVIPGGSSPRAVDFPEDLRQTVSDWLREW